jgi:hypothetical protein
MSVQVVGRATASQMPVSGVDGLSRLAFPPFQPLAGAEIGSFAHGTISKRLPSIVETVITEIIDVSAMAGSKVWRY